MLTALSTTLTLAAICLFYDIMIAEDIKLLSKCYNLCNTNGNVQPTNCFCDTKCSLIYDCCLDSPYRYSTVDTQRNYKLSCLFVYGENRNFSMVDTCKDSWTGHDHVREKCNQTSLVKTVSKNVIDSLPVTNPKTGITYKNYYCAMCNDDSTDDLVEWQVKTLCADDRVTQQDVLKKLKFNEDKRHWGVWKLNSKRKWKFKECYLLFQRPSNVVIGIRLCMAGMISTCPKSWQLFAARRRCESYVNPIRLQGGSVFRNIDCALCHNRTGEEYECVYEETYEMSSITINRAMKIDFNSMGLRF